MQSLFFFLFLKDLCSPIYKETYGVSDGLLQCISQKVMKKKLQLDKNE